MRGISWLAANQCRLEHQCTKLHSDTTLLQPNRTNTPVHTETEQYTHIQTPAPEDECNSIRKMVSNKKTFIKWHQVGSVYSTGTMMRGPINIRFGTVFDVIIFVTTRLLFICHHSLLLPSRMRSMAYSDFKISICVLVIKLRSSFSAYTGDTEIYILQLHRRYRAIVSCNVIFCIV